MNARLVDFVCTAIRYAGSGDELEAQRLLDSPFSAVRRADARALAIAPNRVPLDREGSRASDRFGSALRSLRGEAASARELLATIVSAFSLGDGAPHERQTLDALEAESVAFDLRRGESPLDPRAFAAFLQDHFAGTRSLATHDIHPFARREPEVPHPVHRRTLRFSASALEMYAECERKWFYRYVCSAVEDPGSPASFYGSAFHLALENFHGDVPRPDGADPESLLTRLVAWINAAFDKYRSGFGGEIEFELHRRRARRTARRYIAWLLERSRSAPFTVVGREAEVELDLQGYTFIGYIDRIDRDDVSGALTVVDYKTGHIAESAREYRDDITRFIEFQLPFYYWAQTMKGERVTRLALVPLREPHGEVVPVELEVVPLSAPPIRGRARSGTIGIDELERARTKMVEIARYLTEERIVRFPPAMNPEVCTYCVYRHSCRERPVAEAERFHR